MSDTTTPSTTTSQRTTTVVLTQKSTVLALVLSFFFGPLGMLYATVLGGVVMFIVSIPVVLLTAGFGLLLTIPIGMVWSAVAVGNYNKKLLGRI